MVRRMLRISILALPLILGVAFRAEATASLTCEAADRNLSFSLLGNLGSGGGSVQLIGGEIKLKALRGKFGALEYKVEAGHLAGQWNFGDELRIGIAPKSAGDVSIYLAIIAERIQSADTERYRGRYVAKIQGPKGATELKGPIKGCEAG